MTDRSHRILAATAAAALVSLANPPQPLRADALPPDCLSAVKVVDPVARRPAGAGFDDAALHRLEDAKGDFQQCQTQSTDHRVIGLGVTGALFVDLLVAMNASRQAARFAPRGPRDDHFFVAKDTAIATFIVVDGEAEIAKDLPLERDDAVWTQRARALARHRLSKIYELDAKTAAAQAAEIDRESGSQSLPPHWPRTR